MFLERTKNSVAENNTWKWQTSKWQTHLINCVQPTTLALCDDNDDGEYDHNKTGTKFYIASYIDMEGQDAQFGAEAIRLTLNLSRAVVL